MGGGRCPAGNADPPAGARKRLPIDPAQAVNGGNQQRAPDERVDVDVFDARKLLGEFVRLWFARD